MYETARDHRPERAILIGTALGRMTRQQAEYSVDELSRLVTTAGGLDTARFIQKRDKPDGAYFIGKGLVEQVHQLIEDDKADIVVFDDQLSPNQMRSLSEKLDVKVIDRPMLILDIFALHARTAEARLQVELAQMEYLFPRLTRMWMHLSRQQGGIGTKGPGETQLEVDRRQVSKKIAVLKEKLKRVDRQRATQRRGREHLHKIALVGYTNAGKSTLFHCLTRADVLREDKLFSTLDSTTRVPSMEYPQDMVITDTVGFIEKLPHQLVASFRSTLEEVRQADLILIVADCSDPRLERKIGVVREVLDDLGAGSISRLTVYNKVDLVDADKRPEPVDGVIPLSALKKTGLNRLKTELLARFG